MPIVTIRLMEGRPPEHIEAMIAGVSHAIADAIDAPLDTVRVMVTEMQPHQYGVGGRLIGAVKADRAVAATRSADDQPATDRTGTTVVPDAPPTT